MLNQLTDAGCLFCIQEFYSLQNDPFLVERRRKGNAQAEYLLIKAYKISGFIYHFPHVRGIGISGSLSKNFADENYCATLGQKKSSNSV